MGLMYRTAHKNQNIRIDANWALDIMVISVPPLFAIRAMTNCHQKNSAVRITQLRLMHCVAVIADPMKILTGTVLKEARKLILKTCIATIENSNVDIRCVQLLLFMYSLYIIHMYIYIHIVCK